MLTVGVGYRFWIFSFYPKKLRSRFFLLIIRLIKKFPKGFWKKMKIEAAPPIFAFSAILTWFFLIFCQKSAPRFRKSLRTQSKLIISKFPFVTLFLILCELFVQHLGWIKAFLSELYHFACKFMCWKQRAKWPFFDQNSTISQQLWLNKAQNLANIENQ